MPTPSYSTAETIFTQSRGETGVGSSPKSTALQNTAMLRQLHDINHEGVNYPYNNGMLGWKFMEAETIVETVANTTLNGAISSGATSLILDDASDFDSPSSDLAAGYIKTGNDIYDFFTYETKSSNTLSVASGIDMDHADEEEVHKIYKLPSNFGKPRNVFLRSNERQYYFIDPSVWQTPRYNQYTIKVLTSTNGYSASFIVFREDIGAYEFNVRYMKQPTAISATSTTVDMPDGQGRRYLVESLNAYIWTVLGETDLANLAQTKAQRAITLLMGEWGTQTVQPTSNLTLSW